MFHCVSLFFLGFPEQEGGLVPSFQAFPFLRHRGSHLDEVTAIFCIALSVDSRASASLEIFLFVSKVGGKNGFFPLKPRRFSFL